MADESAGRATIGVGRIDASTVKAWLAFAGLGKRSKHQIALLAKDADRSRRFSSHRPDDGRRWQASCRARRLDDRPNAKREGARNLHTLYISPLKALQSMSRAISTQTVAEMAIPISCRDAPGDPRKARASGKCEAAGHDVTRRKATREAFSTRRQKLSFARLRFDRARRVACTG